MKQMFQECNELIFLDLSNFDTSKVTEMMWMFTFCYKLKEIKGINKFNTSNVTNMKAMFNECNELISLDLSNFDTSKVIDMSYMFFNCKKLEYLNILNFSIQNNCKTENIINKINNKCNLIVNIINFKILNS